MELLLTRLQRCPSPRLGLKTRSFFVPALLMAKIYFVGYSRYGLWNTYIDDIEVADAPTVGRCCYGDPTAPSCADNSPTECAGLGGTWTAGLTCSGNPCPVAVLGENCAAPFIIPSLPYTDTQNTADCLNDYGRTEKMLSIRFTITEPSLVDYHHLRLAGFDFDNFIWCLGAWSVRYNYTILLPTTAIIAMPPIIWPIFPESLLMTVGTYYILVEAYGATDGTYTSGYHFCACSGSSG